MSKPFDLERKALVSTLAVVVGIWLFFNYVTGWTANAASVVELERQIIQTTGFILAFTGVIYASVFSEIKFKESKEKRSLAIHLRVGAIGSFLYLFVALIVSMWILLVASNLRSDFQYPVGVAMLTPLSLLAGAFALMIVGMWRMTVSTPNTQD